jgi:hypothetical protein
MSYQAGSAEPEQRAELYAEPREREARPRFHGVVATLVALFVMGIFAGGLWFAYHAGLRHANGGAVGATGGEVPLIRADERPTKVKPEKPGGMDIPDRDKLIYTQKRAAVEHLLPPPEKPMTRPTAPPGTSSQPEAPQPPSAAAELSTVPDAAAAAPAAQQQQRAVNAPPGQTAAAKKSRSTALRLSPAQPRTTARGSSSGNDAPDIAPLQLAADLVRIGDRAGLKAVEHPPVTEVGAGRGGREAAEQVGIFPFETVPFLARRILAAHRAELDTGSARLCG